MELPDLLLKAIESACSTRRQLSWKIQKGPKGTVIQLVWKPNAVNTGNASEVVGTNWSIAPANQETPACRIQQPYQKKKKSPSRIRKDAKRLQAYLEGKNAAKPADSSSKAGHRIELSAALTDVQPTSADEPWPHSLPILRLAVHSYALLTSHIDSTLHVQCRKRLIRALWVQRMFR